MSTGYGTPNPGNEPGAWPPPQSAGVWPPPPTGGAAISPPFPFRTEFRAVEGSVPDFRLGTISFSDQGLLIQGKAIPRTEIRIPVLLVCILLRVGWLIAYLIMEYALRRDMVIQVPWSQVKSIVLNTKQRRACIVYDDLNYKGILKRHSLTTRLDQGVFEAFISTAQQYLPGNVSEGKIKTWTSPVAWIVGIAILVALIFFAISASTRGSHF